ncbi:MAG: siderophore-interacting protein [Myxococcota bacterium]
MAAPTIRSLKVTDTQRLTANFLRITFAGDALSDFPDDFEGGYVKLLFERNGSAVSNPNADYLRAYIKRSYTVRAVDKSVPSLTIDFADHDVAHGSPGPATAWARQARPGDSIPIVGPGRVKRLEPSADQVVAAADPTALPALAVNLELLPDDARGLAFIEVLSEQDRLDLVAPEGVEIRWIVNPKPTLDRYPLVDALTAAPWPQGRVSVWAAGEFNAMRQMRQYIGEQGVAREDLYISSYWKLGSTDEDHKRAKRADANPG